MPNRVRQGVAIVLAAFWVLLSGICFLDEFRFLEKNRQESVYSLKGASSLPVDRAVYIVDESPGEPQFTAVVAYGAGQFRSEPLVLPRFVVSAPAEVPSPTRHKLFQLFSVYRL